MTRNFVSGLKIDDLMEDLVLVKEGEEGKGKSHMAMIAARTLS